MEAERCFFSVLCARNKNLPPDLLQETRSVHRAGSWGAQSLIPALTDPLVANLPSLPFNTYKMEIMSRTPSRPWGWVPCAELPGPVPQACLCAALLHTLAFCCHLVGRNTPQQHSAPDDHGQPCSSHPLFSLNDFNKNNVSFFWSCRQTIWPPGRQLSWASEPTVFTGGAHVAFSAPFFQNVPFGEGKACSYSLLFYFLSTRAGRKELP